ncbi:sperm surface protein Sp17-like isoform X1 [Emydura macquarii macquarii]|uniref:sperm surface protein Sp17-like isoform X1 n=1 Tax=Emydura macquarii macquarii TaxID=1129001 RepID=UPI00352B016A
MSIPFSNTHHRIPLGFANLLEGLAREVLREQPEDIPAFAAKYFEELLDNREKTKYDPVEWGAKLEDRFYNNRAFEEAVSLKEELKESLKDLAMEPDLDKDGPYETSTQEIEDKAARKIQAVYRGYRARETVRRLKEPDQDATDLMEET